MLSTSSFHNMSILSATLSDSSIDSLPFKLSLSSSTRDSPAESPLTSSSDSLEGDVDDYFLPAPKLPSALADVEPSYPKVNNVCFVGAGFVGI